MSVGEQLVKRYQGVMMNAFGEPKRVFVRGQGVHLWDVDGVRYTDLLAGIAVNSLGHAHPAVVHALGEQVQQLGHISNFFASEPQIQLAERLVELAGGGRVFFTNSGTEANEAAFKLTRLTGRTRIVAMTGSFHGRTTGALALTHNPSYRTPFEPLPGQITFVPYGDEEGLAAAVDDSVAAVVVEPIQGEAGVVPAPPGFLAAARRITSQHGALLWVDEVQTGIGRCGEYLLSVAQGVRADLITLAKGLGAGFPIGACIATGPAAQLLSPGGHGSTFGGNPMAARVANVVLDQLAAGVLSNARQVGQWFAARVLALAHPDIVEVRGQGLLQGIVLSQDHAPKVVELALADGWVINAPRPNVLRIAPPLVITEQELVGFVAALPGWLGRCHV